MNEHEHIVSAFRFHVGEYEWVVWPSELVGLALLIFLWWAFYKAHTSKRNPVDFGEMLVWPGTKHTSLAMVLALIGGIISCWVVIDQELKGKLTEGIYIAFLGILVLGKAGTEAINAWRNKAPSPPSPPTPQVNVVQQNPPPTS